MKKVRTLIVMVMSLVLVFSMCMVAGAAETDITLDNAQAVVKGLGYDGNNTIYNEKIDFIVNLGVGSTATYTVPTSVNDTYDIYLEVSRGLVGFGTTPFSISVNDGKAIVPIIEYAFCQKPDYSDRYDKGLFLALKDITLKTGDTITITTLSGFKLPTYEQSFLPCIGDVRLYPAGAKVAVGYDGGIPEDKAVNSNDPLSGLEIIWLGSSVSYGQSALGYSMADYLEESHPALVSHKYTVSATTLVDDNAASYVSRMKEIPTDLRPDLFIVQLSTNDAMFDKPFGTLSSSKNIEAFDTHTIYGAMEYIIAYASETWDCPVVFYSGTYYDSATYSNDGSYYGRMVEALLDIQKKWGILVIDLYNNQEMTAIYNSEKYNTYMADGVHPNAHGYSAWWGPVFEKELTSYLTATPETGNANEQPATNEQTTADELDNVPKTGGNMIFWWALLAAAALATIALTTNIRKTQKS
ncbi:MAG: SGNH/GDSL hydrolase family protein [Syntrophomonadaceae bacterium]|nr:SGNH/GDSL hydrolase family protein [Syntrophomonadaceae bacterium]